MLITAWILLVITILIFIRHSLIVYYVHDMNKSFKVNIYNVKTGATVVFYLALLVFAVCVGIILG